MLRLVFGLLLIAFIVIADFPPTVGRYGQLIDVARQIQRNINAQSGRLYSLDGTIADKATLDTIDRNMTAFRDPIRGLEGFMYRLSKGQAQSADKALQPLSDSKSKIKTPPKAFSLVRSGKLQTKAARQWLETASTFLQTTIKQLTAVNGDDSGRQSPTRNNDAQSLINVYG